MKAEMYQATCCSWAIKAVDDIGFVLLIHFFKNAVESHPRPQPLTLKVSCQHCHSRSDATVGAMSL